MNTDTDQVVVVDPADRALGTEDKMAAHRRGTLHRAFSVVLADRHGRWLLQRRADGKYHSAGLWSNTCCSHPRPGESVADAAMRRLREEMGLSSMLEKLFDFTYRIDFEDGLIEHEFDHVLFGRFNGVPRPDAGEVQAWRWICPAELRLEVAETPERFTFWFRRLLTEMEKRHPALLEAVRT